jgi:pyruvate/2-oxoglutarate/acetoin dehydrogenase E1 component
MTTVLDSLNQGLMRAFASDERVLLLGEDVLDPYGGAFKVTRGLSSAYPGRVLTTPISEAGLIGVASGLALRGLRPVVEIMFGDFMALAADQVINHLAKFRYMYNDQVRAPVVIRTPMGGRRGYGPTHSQTLEKLFIGVPGLTVLAPCALGDPGGLLCQTILETDDPVLFVENKLLYLQTVQEEGISGEFEVREITTLGEGKRGEGYLVSLIGAPPPALTLAAYGYMAGLAQQAIQRLAYEHEIFTELVVLTRLAPVCFAPIRASLLHTGRLLAVEEGSLTLGWGAELLARAAQSMGPRLLAAHRLAAADTPVPASGSLESTILPDIDDIIAAARGMV